MMYFKQALVFTKVKQLITFALIVIAGVYLTFVVDIYTINSTLERVFVFAYFCLFSYALVLVKKRFLKVPGGKIILFSTVTALIILGLFQNTFLPLAQESTITLHAVGKNPSASGAEVWLAAMEVGGEINPLSQMEVSENTGWEYHAEYDDYIFYALEDDWNNRLSFKAFGKNVNLRFSSGPWCGIVEITTQSGTEMLDLYSPNSGDAVDYTISAARQYTLLERIIYNSGAATVMAFLCSALIGALKKQVFRSRVYS